MDLIEKLKELDPDSTTKLRRRVEDYLRKSPAAMLRVAAMLAESGEIKYQDLIE